MNRIQTATGSDTISAAQLGMNSDKSQTLTKTVEPGRGARTQLMETTDLLSMAERTFLLRHIDWTAAAVDITIPLLESDTVALAGNSSAIELLSFYTYLRFDMEILAMVVGTAYQQGALIVSYFPDFTGRVITQTDDNALMNAPHMLLQPNMRDEQVLQVPYQNPRMFLAYPRITQGALGTLRIKSLVPLESASAASASASVNLMIRLKNIQPSGFIVPQLQPALLPFTGVTPTATLLQAGKKQGRANQLHRQLQEHLGREPTVAEVIAWAKQNPDCQMATANIPAALKDLTKVEEDVRVLSQLVKGVPSSLQAAFFAVLAAEQANLNDIKSLLSMNLRAHSAPRCEEPLTQPEAVQKAGPRETVPQEAIAQAGSPLSPVEEVFNGVEKILSPLEKMAEPLLALGSFLDKPADATPPMRVRPRAAGTMMSGVGRDPADPLKVHPHLPDSSHNRMTSTLTLKKLIRTWSYVTKVDVPVAAAVENTEVFRFRVSPQDFVTGTTNIATGETRVRDTYLSAVARVFQWWRGSIEVKCETVQNSFNQARLAWVFWPGNTDLSAPLPGSWSETMAKMHNQLWEVNSSHPSDEFTIPFIAENVARPIPVPTALNPSIVGFPPPQTREASQFAPATGTVHLVVTNKWTVPDAAPTNATFLVYVRGGPDFEFHLPSALGMNRVHRGAVFAADGTPLVFGVGRDDQLTYPITLPSSTVRAGSSIRQALRNVTLNHHSVFAPTSQEALPVKDFDQQEEEPTSRVLENFFGESHMDMYQLMSRYVTVIRSSFASTELSRLRLSVPVTPCLRSNFSDQRPTVGGAWTQVFSDTPMLTFQSLAAWWTGDMKYAIKVIGEDGNQPSVAVRASLFPRTGGSIDGLNLPHLTAEAYSDTLGMNVSRVVATADTGVPPTNYAEAMTVPLYGSQGMSLEMAHQNGVLFVTAPWISARQYLPTQLEVYEYEPAAGFGVPLFASETVASYLELEVESADKSGFTVEVMMAAGDNFRLEGMYTAGETQVGSYAQPVPT